MSVDFRAGGVTHCVGLSGRGAFVNQGVAPGVQRPGSGLLPKPSADVKDRPASASAPAPAPVPVPVLVRMRQTEGTNPKSNVTFGVNNNRGEFNEKPTKGKALDLGAGLKTALPVGQGTKLTLEGKAAVQLLFGTGSGALGRGVLNSDSYTASAKGSAEMGPDRKGSNVAPFLGVEVEGKVSGNGVSPSKTQLRGTISAGAKLAVDLDTSRPGPELNVKLTGAVQERVTLSGPAPLQVVPTVTLKGSYEANKNTTLQLDAGYTFPTRQPADDAASKPGLSVSGGVRVKF
jgi:hypothetical protein